MKYNTYSRSIQYEWYVHSSYTVLIRFNDIPNDFSNTYGSHYMTDVIRPIFNPRIFLFNTTKSIYMPIVSASF